VAKGADCKAGRLPFIVNAHSEKLAFFDLFSINRLAAVSEWSRWPSKPLECPPMGLKLMLYFRLMIALPE